MIALQSPETGNNDVNMSKFARKKIVKPHQVNLFLADFSNLEPAKDVFPIFTTTSSVDQVLFNAL